MYSQDFLLSIVIPTHNEETNIPILYKRLINVFTTNKYNNYEILFIDDSTDSTPEVIKEIIKIDNNVGLVKLSRKFGQSIAITAGLERCNGDIIIMMDADLQDPPEKIPDFIKKWKEGYSVVYAKRDSSSNSKLYFLLSKLFYKLQSNVSSINIPQNVGEFRLIDRKVLLILNNLTEKTRFMRGLTLWPGFKHCAIEIEREDRFSGTTNYNLKKSFIVALDGLASFSIAPLRYSLFIGVFMFLTSILGILYVMIPRIINLHGNIVLPSGNTLLTIALLCFSGLQFFLLGIIGEYIGRIYTEILGRPSYVVDYEILKKEGNIL